MTLFVICDMLIGVILAFAAVFFWEKNSKNSNSFLIVLAALFNYLYSFFRVLEGIGIIPSDWFLSIGTFPLLKFIIVIFSMVFFIIGLMFVKNEKEIDK
ncbi:MAG: hypothetical protein KBG82_08955 [Spirochaetes bacterium]|nr:hypothetical protein [Spirochaetota bacterium]HNV43640.1 hypothetical protein [Exilispira sp.]MBP8992092.1 hypothetical protein [Spirochaetota bacterium]HOV46651.1 hypothetical protein [Exilispira sp.]HPB48065.1 hypothetical protein [Exilispira sp.]